MRSVTSEYYVQSGAHSRLDDFGEFFDSVPSTREDVFSLVKSIIVHPARSGMPDSPANRRIQMDREARIGSAGDILSEILSRNSHISRFGTGMTGVVKSVYSCPYIALLFCSILRLKQIPARVRVGFIPAADASDFFQHWVTEVYDSVSGSWEIFDADETDACVKRSDFIFPVDMLLRLGEESDERPVIPVILHDLHCLFKDELTFLRLDAIHSQAMAEWFLSSASPRDEIIQCMRDIEPGLSRLGEIYRGYFQVG